MIRRNGKLYLYGSKDISGTGKYCSKEYHVFSTADTVLYAPDAIFRNGKYYLYACGSNNFEVVAESDTPEGPFVDAKPITGADGDGIDPAVFVDEDGQAYYFWGQFRLKGAKLNEDMCTLDMGSLHESILTEMEHGFHEGASIRKRNGKYYMVYTDVAGGRATRMSYAMADSPLGPYKKGGVIIDNVYCDPQSWNNHGSIENVYGQWYVFYHRSSQNSKTSRRIILEASSKRIW